jgi:HTH-type transcriptional regulator, sugar sensing transcriptional regulator
MNQEPFIETLVDLGLTNMDAQVYIFLAKKGPHKGKDILRAMKMNRQQLYRSLKSLQNKGIVSSTFEHPARFSAFPFEKVLEMFIKTKMDETQRIQENEANILSKWQSIVPEETVDASARFMVIQGRNRIYTKILQMINETKSQLLTISTVQGLVRASQFGLFDAGVKHTLKSNIQFRFLTELSKENVGVMKSLFKGKPDNTFNFEGRDVDSGLNLLPRLVIKDEEELVFFITSIMETTATEQEDTGIWTNSKPLVHAFKAFFEELWLNSTIIRKKMVEIETGKPTPETRVIKDAEVAQKKYEEIIGSAKKEITGITSSKGVLRFWKKAASLRAWTGHGLCVRIMAPIIDENLKAAQQLSKYCEVRHVATSYLRTTVVDGKHLFMFKSPPPDQEKLEGSSYFEGMFYTNDIEYVERAKDMLADIWNGASSLSTVIVQSVTRSPAPTVSPSEYISEIVEIMTKQDVGAVIVLEGTKPLGIITEKDILSRVIKDRKDPEKTLAKEIMSAPLITIDQQQASNQALEIMHKNNIRRLAVVSGEKLVGLLTERRALGSFSLQE